MKIKISQLRRIIREQLAVSGMFTGPERLEREPMLKVGGKIDDEMSSHLLEPVESAEDCYGPVPPSGEETYVTTDPLARFWGQG